MKTRALWVLILDILAASVLLAMLNASGGPLPPAPANAAGMHPAAVHHLSWMADASGDLCPPLSPPTGTVVTVTTEAELRDRAHNAAAGTTIMVSPGTYNLGDVVHIVNDDIAVRGATGNRDDVILDGGGMLATGRYHVILIDADGVTIADLTIRNGDEHAISVNGSDRPRLYNLHILDAGYQLVKINPIGDGSEDGLLACSRLEYTTTSPEDYTNGISAHDAHDWTVRDNQWYRIRTPGNAPVPTILFWSGSSGTLVERNLLVDCYQGISFGNASHGAGDHTGGIVRNNVIYASQPHDVVVEMVHASGWLVAHNTALLLSPDGVTHGMEARFPDASGTFAYNLTNMDIPLNRDGGHGTGLGNVTNAQSSWFVDASSADLHLVASATEAIDQAAPLPEVSDDYDGDARPHGSAPDVGADEYGPSAPTASLSLTAPTGSTAWPIDSQRAIRWTTAGSVPQVDLYYSTDSFVTSETVASGVANVGVYTWTTPSTPTHSARVRVASAADPTVQSTSGQFSLYDPGTLTNTIHLPLVLNHYVPHLATQRIYSTNLTYRGAFAYPSGDDVFHNAKTCNYLFKAPEGFGDENLDGKWLIAGNHREAGALGGSQGPTLYALAPWGDGNPPASGQNLDALALLYYPEIYPGCLDNPEECHFPDYRPKDSWGGGAWVQTTNRSGVLVFGRKGLGDNCYGTQAECGGDPCDMYKGYHAYPYEPQILFYDRAQLAEVVAGTREPWEVLPYEVYSPADEVLDQECATFGAVAYDQERRLIYATEQEAGPSGETVVHVWSVGE